MTQINFKEPPIHFSKVGLKQRGWTDKAIDLFLVPDKVVDNPHYKSAPKMQLYLIKRVEDIEKSAEFQHFQDKNKKRVVSSKKAVETKRKRLLKEVQNWAIHLKSQDYQEVLKNAIKSYNRFKQETAFEHGWDNYDFQPTMDSDKEFIERITVNYLRHNQSNYDNKLDKLFGKVGKSEAYNILNRKIYDKITEVYPQLSAECKRQIQRKTDAGKNHYYKKDVDKPVERDFRLANPKVRMVQEQESVWHLLKHDNEVYCGEKSANTIATDDLTIVECAKCLELFKKEEL